MTLMKMKTKTTSKRKRTGGEDAFDFFTIDQNHLDREWVLQPKLMFKYSRKVVEANEDVERTKAALELCAAEIDGKIRALPKKFGITTEKITEGAIKAALQVQDAYIVAQRRLRKATHAAGVLRAAVHALDHRKKALENLVDLRLADYFSEPRASPAAREDMEEVSERSLRKRGQRPHKRGSADDDS